MEIESMIEKEFEKIENLKQLRDEIKRNDAFDSEDVEHVEKYIEVRTVKLREKQKLYEEVYHIKKLIEARENVLQNFENQTQILSNSNLITYFKGKQKNLLRTLESLYDPN